MKVDASAQRHLERRLATHLEATRDAASPERARLLLDALVEEGYVVLAPQPPHRRASPSGSAVKAAAWLALAIAALFLLGTDPVARWFGSPPARVEHRP